MKRMILPTQLGTWERTEQSFSPAELHPPTQTAGKGGHDDSDGDGDGDDDGDGDGNTDGDGDDGGGPEYDASVKLWKRCHRI